MRQKREGIVYTYKCVCACVCVRVCVRVFKIMRLEPILGQEPVCPLIPSLWRDTPWSQIIVFPCRIVTSNNPHSLSLLETIKSVFLLNNVLMTERVSYSPLGLWVRVTVVWSDQGFRYRDGYINKTERHLHINNLFTEFTPETSSFTLRNTSEDTHTFDVLVISRSKKNTFDKGTLSNLFSYTPLFIWNKRGRLEERSGVGGRDWRGRDSPSTCFDPGTLKEGGVMNLSKKQ